MFPAAGNDFFNAINKTLNFGGIIFFAPIYHRMREKSFCVQIMYNQRFRDKHSFL